MPPQGMRGAPEGQCLSWVIQVVLAAELRESSEVHVSRFLRGAAKAARQ